MIRAIVNSILIGTLGGALAVGGYLAAKGVYLVVT